MNLCEHGNKRPCFECEYDGEPAGAYVYAVQRKMCVLPSCGNFPSCNHYEDCPVHDIYSVFSISHLCDCERKKNVSDKPAGAYKYNWHCHKCLNPLNLCRCHPDDFIHKTAIILETPKVTGKDNPFYDLPYPVGAFLDCLTTWNI